MKKKSRNTQVGPQLREGKPADKYRKIYFLVFVLTLILALQTATQITAYLFEYHPYLGGHLTHVHWPWMVFIWAGQFGGQYSDIFTKAFSSGFGLAALPILGILVHKMVVKNTSRAAEYMHGSARWADMDDVTSMSLLDNEGVYIGGWKDEKGKTHYLRHNGPEHILCFAPTRSGKGVGLVIPTLLSWPHSAVVTDLKGELYAITAGWRKKHANNIILKFEPAAKSGSVSWNPLEEIRLGEDEEVPDTQNIANLIVDPDGKGLEDHWSKTAFSLFVGVIMHLLYKSKNDGTPATMAALSYMLSDTSRPITELWEEMMSYPHVNGSPHPAVAKAGRDMADRPENEAGSVVSTAKSYLSLYDDPIVQHNTSRCDFKIKDLMHSDNPVSLFIITQPVDKDRLKPLVRILINMTVRLLADKMEFESGRTKATYKHRLLQMLDEFPSLGKLDIIQESAAFVAGYGIKMYFIVQDISQLHKSYTKDESITSNTHVQIAYPPNRIETAEHLSRLSGQTTIIKEQVTTSGNRISMMHKGVSTTLQEVQRPLLTPDESMRMPGPIKNSQGDITEGGDMVMFISGFPAIYGKQILYFKDPVFMKRSTIAAPETDTIRKPNDNDTSVYEMISLDDVPYTQQEHSQAVIEV